MIEVAISKCTGCRRCETACSFYHTGRISPRLSRIKVLHIYENGLDGPVLCVQCRQRYCLKCPSDALTVGPQGQVIVSPTLCTLCGACQNNCPIGAIEIFGDLVYVCDLCGGDPKCVEACTEGAIKFVPSVSETVSLEDPKKNAGRCNTSTKRYLYLLESGRPLLEQWSRKNA